MKVKVACVIAGAASAVACASQQSEPVEPIAPIQRTEAPVTPAFTGPTPGTIADFVQNVGDRVYFDFNQYSLTVEARGLLQSQAAWLDAYPETKILVAGNCDERGTREYNLALGARRANAVKDYLIAQGVSADRITTISYGKERPIDPASNDGAWARNRNSHTQIVSGAASS